jgi:hypothetical protein
MNPYFRPQAIATAEIDRSAVATGRLLSAPADWLRRLHCARLDVDLAAHSASGLPVLEREGFRPLCTAWLRHPGPTGRIQRQVDVWIDPTTTIRAEIVGHQTRRVYLSTLFDDGSSLVSLPDPTVAEWIRSASCHVLCATDDLRTDLATFREQARKQERAGRTALLCANGAAYRLHLRVSALRSKRPQGSIRAAQPGLLYPMTLMLAAEMVARRDEHADRMGLPVVAAPE